MENEMNLDSVSRQRACLMGLFTAILQDNTEGLTVLQIKKHCVDAFAYMIDHDVMVGDVIDIMTAEACMEFCEQEKALEDVNNLLNGE